MWAEDWKRKEMSLMLKFPKTCLVPPIRKLHIRAILICSSTSLLQNPSVCVHCW